MSRGKKAVIVILCVIIGIIVLASVILRVIFTDERLAALVTPRLEKAVGVKVSIDEIGLRFPFGFGVDVGGLKLTKDMEAGKSVDFQCKSLTVNASLISLIRRRPEISDFSIHSGNLSFSDSVLSTTLDVYGIKSHVSVMPGEGGYSIRPDIAVDSVSVIMEKNGFAVVLGKIGFNGELRSDQAFDSLDVTRSRIGWDNVFATSVSGRVSGFAATPWLDLHIQTEELDVAALANKIFTMERVGSLRLPGEKELGQSQPIRVKKGNLRLDVDVSGSIDVPAEMSYSGQVELEEIEVEHDSLGGSIFSGGTVVFSNEEISTDDLYVNFGDSGTDLAARVKLSPGSEIERIFFNTSSNLFIKDVCGLLKLENLEMDGRVSAEMEGGGDPGVLIKLFPTANGKLPDGKTLSAQEIDNAWKDFDLEGEVSLGDIRFSSPEMPYQVSSFESSAHIKGGSIDKLEGSFKLGDCPFAFRGQLKNFFPAIAEVFLVAQQKRTAAEGKVELGQILDSAVSKPHISINVTAGTFDLRPFEEDLSTPAKDAGRKEKGKPVATTMLENPLMPLFLKSTAYSARVDSIVTRRAVITALDMEGKIQNGILKTQRSAMSYAGGKGDISLILNLRNPDRISGVADVTFDGIEAGQAVRRISKLGDFLRGRFFFNSHAEFTAGEDVSPLTTLNATGSARSDKGELDLSSLTSSVSGGFPVGLFNLRNLSYSNWSGDFTVEGGRFITDNWRMNSSSGDWLIAGSFGLDGTLDYSARLVVPPSIQSGMKDLSKYRDLVDLLKDEKGNLVLNFDLGGSVKSPLLSLDTSKARERAGKKLLDNLKEKAWDWFKK